MMTVHPIGDEALGNTAYLLEAGDGVAVAVDPRRDAGDHLALARRLGLRIEAVLETHLHADFVGGSREIAEETGAVVYAAADARLGFPHAPLRPGDRVRAGAISIEAVPTPGHTPEHLAYLARGNGAPSLFSGGSLIVGGAARTDLTGAARTEELARAQFASLRRLAALPNATALYPTHGAGSFCSTGPAQSAASTIGAERRTNPLLRIAEEDDFVERLLAGYGSYPRYFAHLRDVNQAGAPLLSSLPPVPRLDAGDAAAAVGRGAWLVDGRGTQAWASAHAQGAVSIAVRPAFASWLGWVVPFGAPVVLMLDPGLLDEALRLARRIGYDRIDGWTTFEEWQAAGLPVASVDVLDPAGAAARMASGALMLDVRQRAEFEDGHVAGATHIELGDLIAGKAPGASEVVAYCGHGERSATAASLLERRGIGVANLRGGIAAWRGAGLPLSS